MSEQQGTQAGPADQNQTRRMSTVTPRIVTDNEDNICLNVDLVKYDAQLGHRATHQFLSARGFGTRKHPVTMEDRGANEVLPTTKEIWSDNRVPEEGYKKVLWVGMWPRDAPQYSVKARRSSKKRTGANTTLKHDSNALRVVVAIENRQNASYYVCINPDEEGICDTKQIPQDEVFYFPEWRGNDITGGLEGRKGRWAAEIRGFLGLSGKDHRSGTSNVPTRAEQAPVSANHAEVLSSGSTHKDGDRRAAEYPVEALELLKQVDLLPEELASSDSLKRMMDGSTLLELDDAESALAQFKLIYGEKYSTQYDATLFQQISIALFWGHIRVSSGHLPAFVHLFNDETTRPKVNPMASEEATRSLLIRYARRTQLRLENILYQMTKTAQQFKDSEGNSEGGGAEHEEHAE